MMKLFFKHRDEDEAAAEEEIVVEEETPPPPPEDTEALPEAPEVISPAPLIAGAFLHDRWEIIQLTRRGTVNFYQAADEESPQVQVQIAQQHHDAGCFTQALDTPLWQPLDVFSEDDCDYAAFDGGEFRALSDRREAPVDERYLRMLQTLVAGLGEWQEKGLKPVSDDLWGVDLQRQLHYYGFLTQEPQGQEDDYGALLRTVNQRLLKQVFAPTATMRLEDPWSALPFCQETIDLIRDIQEHQLSLRDSALRLEALAPTKVLLADVALQTDVGQERELNEDSGAILYLQRRGQLHQIEIDLWLVADGMGGHESGEVASDLAVTAMQRRLMERLADINFHDNAMVRNALFEIAGQVNQEVYEYGAAGAARTPPGTTLVAALRVGRRLFVINVGDSRAYLWSEQRGLVRVSRDHSYVQDLLDRGEITPEQVFGHPQGNIITSNIGLKKLEQCDVFLRLALPGDKLLLVSDGVVDMLPEETIIDLLKTPGAAALCQTLVDASNAAGGVDNITALAVEFSGRAT